MTRKCGLFLSRHSGAMRSIEPGISRFRVHASRAPERLPEPLARSTEPGLQRRNARLQRLVLLARQAGHLLHRLEFLALDHVEIAQDAFGLVAHDGVDLALDALRGAGGVVHQTADLIEKPVAGLGHLAKLSAFTGLPEDNGDPRHPVQVRREWQTLRQLALSCSG